VIKKRSKRRGKIEIDLTGPEGNAYVLMGYVQLLSKQLDRDPKPVLDEMMSGDYEHLVRVFDREFGHIVTLYR
jgi:hypothetical protein